MRQLGEVGKVRVRVMCDGPRLCASLGLPDSATMCPANRVTAVDVG